MKLDLMDKLAELDRALIMTESDLISTKNQFEDLKRQLVLNNKELDHQLATEQKLRRDLNRNLNQDLDLKKERDRVNFLRNQTFADFRRGCRFEKGDGRQGPPYQAIGERSPQV